MNKKLISAITLGMVATQFSPYLAYALPNETSNDISDEKVETNDGGGNTDKVQVSEKIDISKTINWAEKYPKLVNPDKKDIKPIKYNSETILLLDNLIKDLDEIESNYSKESLMNVLTQVLELNINMEDEEINLHREYDQIDYILYKAIYLGFTNSIDDNERGQLMLKFIDDMYLSSAKRYNSGKDSCIMADYAYYIGNLGTYFDYETGVKINIGASLIYNIELIKPDIENGSRPIINENMKPSDYNVPSKPEDDTPENSPDLPEIEAPSIPELEPILPEPIVPEDEDMNIVENPQDFNMSSEDYVANGNICYKVTTKYDINGNILSTNSEQLPSNEKGFCNIYDYEIINGDTWNENQNGDFALEVWESLGQNDLNKVSNHSIHFTVNKDNEKPYYYDSGIRVSTDMTATYSQIKDVLTQISLKMDNGYIIEDNDKLLFIADGKPLVVKDKKAEYSQSEIEGLLNVFTTVGLKVDTISQLKQETIETQVNTGNLTDITIDGDTFTLSKDPIVDNGILQLPIEEVSKQLGATVENKSNKLTITKDGKVIEYLIGTKDVTINGTTKKLSTTSQNKDGVVYGEMTLVAKELGYTLTFDSLVGKIEFNK